ncbi:MAG: SurA N-terminal domain-containing protein [Kiritimatiellae bacterium]|nr:SurA N-terminal domain-containing protein [Kiritimatiellia bacterium]
MLISKFNKMIRNKFIWGAVAFIVCISFVFSYSAVSSGCSKNPAGAVATLFGEDVKSIDLRLAMLFEQGLEPKRNMTDDEQEQLEDSAWKRLAVLKLAADMELVTPLHEVGTLIRQSPSFATPEGAFSREKYARTVGTRLGVDTGTFERFQQENLTIEKLYSTMGSMVWTSPFEINTKVRDLTDQFKMEYALLDAKTFTPETVLTNGEHEAFFAENKELFREPKRVSVQYVAFPFTNYVTTNAPSDEQLSLYYDDHLDDFKVEDSTNILAQYKTLNDVRDDIIALLSDELEIMATRDAAENFVYSLLPEGRRKAPSFETRLAEDKTLKSVTTEPFGIDESVSGVEDAGSKFNEAAFALIPNDATAKYSDVVLGTNAAYVLVFESEKESYIPDFESVSDSVIPLAQAAAERDAFIASVDAIAETAKTAANADTNATLGALLASHKVEANETEYFSVFSSFGTNQVDHVDDLSSVAAKLAPGQISSPIEVDDGVLLARLIDRRAGTAQDSFAFTPQVRRTLAQYRSSQVFEAWRNYVLAQANFTDLRTPIADEESL